MEIQEVTNLLKHYRHDWMNQLQLVHGYASMDKMDKVKEKVQAIIDASREESKLMSLHAPQFALWLIQFNMMHQDIRLTYNVTATVDFSNEDQSLFETCTDVVSVIKDHKDTLSLIQLHVDIGKGKEGCVHIRMNGSLHNEEAFCERISSLENVQDLNTTMERNETLYIISIKTKER
ncbi:Spo0B domain-containing protein [Pontibacillus salicampi]|uniref:Spo0B domain-containing protein n=1 Tax=Pontibacillus salicampi TaxID=1449801 RepID=A0ABV6LJG7_9BACI